MFARLSRPSLVVTLFLTSAGFADNLTVCPDGCEYTSIQEAISAAQSGDTILIGPGTYYEHDINLQGKAVVINGSLDGSGELTTTVDAEGLDTVFRSQSGPEGTALRNLILTGGNGYQANSTSDRFGGAVFLDGGNMLIENCLVIDNYARTWAGGVYAFSTNLEIRDSTFIDNRSNLYSAVKNFNGSTLISNCTIASNVSELGGTHLDLRGSGVHEIRDCRFACNSPEFMAVNDVITEGNCLGLDCPDADLDGDYVPDYCTNAVSVCADGCSYASVIDAIDDAPANDYHIIQLAPGTYCEGSVIDLDGKPISLRGISSEDGRPLTDLSGSGLHRVVVCNSNESEQSELRDLVIHSGVDHDGAGGAGMLIDGSGPRVSNCVFYANHASGNGGGLRLKDYEWSNADGAAGITGCLFIDNTADQGGGISAEGFGSFGLTIEECLIARNSANSGGGIHASMDFGMSRCSVIDNAGGGISSTSDFLFMQDSYVHGNSSFGVMSQFLWLSDATICGNSGEQIVGEPFGDSTYCVSDSCDDCTSQDSDGDGIVDHLDMCPGGDDTIDADKDGIPDFCDDHLDAGADCDGDGIPDQDDICPGGDDLADRDFDGTPDFCDECPDNPERTVQDACGCLGPDGSGVIDTDMDGTPDCLDFCPDDPNKVDPGFCGCNVVDTNVNGDVDCDGDFDEDDIRLGMANFGIQEASGCLGDLDGDGEVGPLDLAIILGSWGVCP